MGQDAPMIIEIDIYRSAQVLLRQYGDDAVLVATSKADEMLASVDLDGQALWKRIAHALDELTSLKPPPSARFQ